MRPKGWRNDTRWVEFYKRREDDRLKREVALAKLQFEMAQDAVRIQRSIESLRKPRFVEGSTWG
jgi:hypothetical protein